MHAAHPITYTLSQIPKPAQTHTHTHTHTLTHAEAANKPEMLQVETPLSLEITKNVLLFSSAEIVTLTVGETTPQTQLRQPYGA